MLDQKGRLFGKINILDLIFILIFLIVAVFAVYYFTDQSNAQGTIPVTYTVEVQNKEASYFDHVVVGGNVKSGYTGVPMGKIVGFSKAPAKVIVETNGAFAVAIPENRYDGYIQIQVDAGAQYPNILLDDKSVKIGSEMALRSETLAIHGFVVDMDFDMQQLKEGK